jgi:hypothetical protein
MAVIPNLPTAGRRSPRSEPACRRHGILSANVTSPDLNAPRYTNCVPSASLFTVQISMIAQIQLTTAA